jgi:hypothetical protein
MKKLLLYLIFIMMLIFAACSDEAELDKSVFIPDNENPNLPAYTEWGYNTFGAYYERDVFKYNDWEIPAKIVITGGRTSFILKGQKGASDYYYGYNNNDMSITFDLNLQDPVPSVYTDLVRLNSTIIDLTQGGNKVYIKLDANEFEAQILNGKLEIKKAQILKIDTKQIEVILSGYFDFQTLIDEEPISISLGRFDVGIGPSNFFVIEK